MKRMLGYMLCLILLAVAIGAGLGWVNASVSLDHARQQGKIDRQRSELLSELLIGCRRGAKRPDVMKFLQENASKSHVIKEEPSRILVDDVVFQFDEEQTLSKVQFSDSVE